MMTNVQAALEARARQHRSGASGVSAGGASAALNPSSSSQALLHRLHASGRGGSSSLLTSALGGGLALRNSSLSGASLLNGAAIGDGLPGHLVRNSDLARRLLGSGVGSGLSSNGGTRHS